MPRIIVQTDDRDTVLDSDVRAEQLGAGEPAVDLVESLYRAVKTAEARRGRPRQLRSRAGCGGLTFVCRSTEGPFE